MGKNRENPGLVCKKFSYFSTVVLSGKCHSYTSAVIFLPARPGSQTHASHKGRMILNHESPAGCIKIVAKSLHLVFATFVLSVFFLTCAPCLE